MALLMASSLFLARSRAPVVIASPWLNVAQRNFNTVKSAERQEDDARRKKKRRGSRQATGEDGVSFHELKTKAAHPSIDPSVFYDGLVA